jgi:hypothetical protein
LRLTRRSASAFLAARASSGDVAPGDVKVPNIQQRRTLHVFTVTPLTVELPTPAIASP